MDSNHKNHNSLPPLEVLVDDETECLQPAVGSDRGSKTRPLTPFLSHGVQLASLWMHLATSSPNTVPLLPHQSPRVF